MRDPDILSLFGPFEYITARIGLNGIVSAGVGLHFVPSGLHLTLAGMGVESALRDRHQPVQCFRIIHQATAIRLMHDTPAIEHDRALRN
jgi:hypothetical protein